MLPLRRVGERFGSLAGLVTRAGERPGRRAPGPPVAAPASRAALPSGPAGLALLAVVGCAAALFLLFGIALAERVSYRGHVLPGVHLDGVEVAGRAEPTARQAVSAAAARLEREPLTVRAGQARLGLRPAAVRVVADERATAGAVLAAGRHGNPLGQLLGPVVRRLHAIEVPWAVSYDRGALARTVDGWAVKVERRPVDGGLRVEGATVTPVAPQAGLTLDRPGAVATVAAALVRPRAGVVDLPVGERQAAIGRDEVDRVTAQARTLLAAPVTITVSGQRLTADPAAMAAALRAVPSGGQLGLALDSERLRVALAAQLRQVERPGREARFQVTGGQLRIVPSTTGQLVDLGPVTAAMLAGERSVQGTLVTAEPRHNTAWARALGIRHKVSEFTTRHAPGQPRVSNIHRAADLLRGIVVEPGQRFSLNQAVGPRTAARGFVRAPVIDQGSFSEDFGGGVSQLATTTFNAIFFGGYKIVTYQPHSFYISRYPMGREATVSLPAPDLVFVNDTRAGVLIHTAYTDSSVTVTFFGDTGGRVVRAEGPRILATHEPTGEREEVVNPELPAGTVITEPAFTGYDVEVFRVIQAPGQPVRRERFFTRYKSANPTVIRGTGPPA